MWRGRGAVAGQCVVRVLGDMKMRDAGCFCEAAADGMICRERHRRRGVQRFGSCACASLRLAED